MDIGWYVGLFGFALAMAATPGPNNTMATASGAIHGMRRSLPLISGIAIGVAGIMFLVAISGSALIAEPGLVAVLKWVGVGYLLWIAWQVARAEPELVEGSTGAAPLSFRQGMLSQAVNPKLWVMASGAVVAFGQVGDAAGYGFLGMLFALVFGAMTFVSTVAWAMVGAWVGRLLVSPRALRMFNIAMALLLVASLIPIVLE